jgi:hypothetical protein
MQRQLDQDYQLVTIKDKIIGDLFPYRTILRIEIVVCSWQADTGVV